VDNQMEFIIHSKFNIKGRFVVIIKKINLSIITYILSLFLLLTALNAVDFNIEFHHYLDFSFIHFFFTWGSVARRFASIFHYRMDC
jgi:hypothetical protein